MTVDADRPTGGGAAIREAGTSRRGKGKRSLKYIAIAVGVALVAGAGGGYLYVRGLNANIRKGELNNGGQALAPPPRPNAAGQTPLNILLIGSDGRTSADDCKLGGSCDDAPPHADVEMLVHLSADRSNASVLSIPRDTQVDIPTCTNPRTRESLKERHDIITDSLNVGDPGCVVDTWEHLTRIHIDHYMTIDFAGVVSMADAVGGVEVCTTQNVMDYQPYTDAQGVHHEIGSHLELPAGKHQIQGEQALEWLRTRHAWEDGSDVGRTHAQHLYLNSMIREMKSAQTLTDVGKLNQLAQAATKAVQVDEGLGSVSALADLALEFNKVPTNRITTVTMPFAYVPDPSNPKAALVETTPDSVRVFQMIAQDTALDQNGPAPSIAPTSSSAPPSSSAPTGSAPATSPPSTPAADRAAAHIDVQNGSGVGGRGTTVTEALASQGFSHAVVDTATVRHEPTRLVYPPAQESEAAAVATALDLPEPALVPSSTASHLTLVVGTDWTSGAQWPGASSSASPLPTAWPTSMPASAVTQNAETDAGQCMDVNPAPYRDFSDPNHTRYEYSWVGQTPDVPQP